MFDELMDDDDAMLVRVGKSFLESGTEITDENLQIVQQWYEEFHLNYALFTLFAEGKVELGVRDGELVFALSES